MDKDVRKIYKSLKKIINYIQLLLKKEKIYFKSDLVILKTTVFMNNKEEIELLLNEINLCIDENIESQNCIKKIKEYIAYLRKCNFSYEENMYYLLTADEYLNEILKLKKTRTLYIKDKYKEYLNALNGIQYYNPNNEPRNDISEKIKTYSNFFSDTNPKNSKDILNN